jgi:hypothetical protein
MLLCCNPHAPWMSRSLCFIPYSFISHPLCIDLFEKKKKNETLFNIIANKWRIFLFILPVPHVPLVERGVPAFPEPLERAVVVDAFEHVLGRLDTVELSPAPEEPPDGEELEVHERERPVPGPVRLPPGKAAPLPVQVLIRGVVVAVVQQDVETDTDEGDPRERPKHGSDGALEIVAQELRHKGIVRADGT